MGYCPFFYGLSNLSKSYAYQSYGLYYISKEIEYEKNREIDWLTHYLYKKKWLTVSSAHKKQCLNIQ